MDVWRDRRWAVGSAAGLTVTGLAVIAHRSAGGTLGAAGLMFAFGAAALVAGEVSRWIRLDFARLLMAAVVAQPALHLVLGIGGNHHHAHVHHDAVAPPASTSPLQMWIAHAVLAAAAAVVVRWGGRWLRVMPAVVRAIVAGPRNAIVRLLADLGAVGDSARPAMAAAAVATVDCRGPPTGA